MSTRRTFIQQAGILTAATLLNPVLSRCNDTAERRKVGIQLYTLRDEIAKDLVNVITRIEKTGYEVVETYGYSLKEHFWGLSPAKFSHLLKSHNLSSFSGHYDLDNYLKRGGNDDDLKIYVDVAAEIGQTYVIVPFIAPHIIANADDYKQVADKLNRAGELCKASGLKFGYHNHDFEFKITAAGSSGYDILLKNTDANLVDFELDLYWTARTGKDPVELFKEHSGRFRLWHVKDMDKANASLTTEVGNGSIDFERILRHASDAGLKQLYVEQEGFRKDPFESISQSFKYINSKLG